MQPDAGAVVVAYYLSAVTIEYLVATMVPKIVTALQLFGKGRETPGRAGGDHRQEDRRAWTRTSASTSSKQRLASYAAPFTAHPRGSTI
ncbi:MAG: hypothetical protein IPI49_33415 [Myxococcales bacterium]|nr:hypothetical protein [Myxococcales bacterium]